jgi:hypothetical protein
MSLYDGYCADSYVPVLVARVKPAPIVSSIKEDDSEENHQVMKLLERDVSYKDFVFEKVKEYVGYCNIQWCDRSVYGRQCAGPLHSIITADLIDIMWSNMKNSMNTHNISWTPFHRCVELGIYNIVCCLYS